MPTVLRKNGFQVIIWTDDHEPMHVHIFRAEGEIIVNLNMVTVRDNYGMRKREARQALRLVLDNQTFLIERWREIHG